MRYHRLSTITFLSFFLVTFQISGHVFFVNVSERVSHLGKKPEFGRTKSQSSVYHRAYLPLIQSQSNGFSPKQTPKINVPYFEDEIRFSETGIFWFGKVAPAENYADVRIGYNPQELYIRLAMFDRLLWYDTTPTRQELTSWDAVSIYLNTDGVKGNSPSSKSFRFTGQLNWWEPRSNYQIAYQGDGSNWVEAPLSFSTQTAYRGDSPNNDDPDAGWWITFRIPFASLGLSGAPSQGHSWGLAVILHDRDDASDTSIPEKTWPTNISSNKPETWGILSFGLPGYTSPGIAPAGTTIIRHNLNGAKVMDGMVGGFSNCGKGLDKWTEWGEKNYAGASQINIQNQFDVADWPCFSKYYVTFPLDSIPQGAKIISAKLTLHQFGNAGGGEYGDSPVSLIQVFTIAEDWEESTLTWNNAPWVLENVSRAWVDPITGLPDPPGVPWVWDMSKAVVEAHATRAPLRLALYSADAGYNSGKYFYSSDVGDWNSEGRPTLEVVWGIP